MIFYTAINADNKIVVKATQADIKEVNKDFDKIDVPTSDKSQMLDWIQLMLDELHNNNDVASVPAPEPTKPTKEETPKNPDSRWGGNDDAKTKGFVCSICARTPKGSRIMEQVFDSMDVQDAVHRLTDIIKLDNIINQVNSRKRFLLSQTQQESE